jgi:hypothetical protein
MKLYLLSQNQNTGYDTYSDLVVCAKDEEEARHIHPSQYKDNPWADYSYSTWCMCPEDVDVEYIGEASEHLKKGIVCASFHAG